MKKTIVATILGIVTLAASVHGQGRVFLDNYSLPVFPDGYPRVTFGAGSGGAPGGGVGSNFKVGLYWASGIVTVTNDPAGIADPATLGPLMLGTGPGAETPIIFDGFFASPTEFTMIPLATGSATVVVVAYNGSNYAGSTIRGHSAPFQITPTLAPNIPPYIGTVMPPFSVFSNTISPPASATCVAPPSGLVAWWPGNNDTFDSVGTNHGTLLNGTTFAPGKAGLAFSFDGVNDYVLVNSSSALDVGAGAGFTMEGWIKPASTAMMPVFEFERTLGTFDGNDVGVHLYISHPALGGGSFYVNVLDTNQTSHTVSTGPGLVKAGVWQHIALSYDKATGQAVIYLNGAPVTTTDLGSFTPQTTFANLLLGARTTFGSTASPADKFSGLMDEISFFSRALASNEIAAIYAARGAGKCPLSPTVLSVTPPGWNVNEGQTVSFSAVATGTTPLHYQWLHDGNLVAGATSSTLVLSNVVFAQAGSYSVLVSNIAGTATSSNVVLDVNRAPIADASATDALVVAPLNCDGVSLASVVLDGSNSSDPDADPLSYSWFQDGVSNAIATGVVAVVQLPVGSNHLTLVVNDGMASSSQPLIVEVISTDTAVERLMTVVQADADRPQPLIASLRAALASIDRCQPQTAINHLEAFKNKVLAQVAPNDPALANLLLGEAQSLIDILNGGAAPAAALEITEISQGNNGKPHLKIKGAAGRVHIVETSTDMVNWVKIGVAGCNGGCDYEFNDAQTSDAGARFYRVVSPR